MVHVAAGQFGQALSLFEAVLQRRPGDATASTNAAVCRLYTHDVPGAIATLENCVRSNPAAAGDPAVLANLGALYDLAYDDSAKRKRTLRNVLSVYAPHLLDSPDE